MTMKRRTAASYVEMLFAILPRGWAWPRDFGTVLRELLTALAQELARVANRIYDLVIEQNTLTTSEMLTDHETDLGIPDECIDLEDTTEERRRYANAKLTSVGGQSKIAFIELADSLGYDVTIDEFSPAIVGVAGIGDYISDPDRAFFYWRVNVNTFGRIIYAAVGDSVIGDLMSEYFGVPELECIFNKFKPAHTHIIFQYLGPEFSIAFSRAFNSVPSDFPGYRYGSFNGYEFSPAFDLYLGGAFSSDAFSNAFDHPM